MKLKTRLENLGKHWPMGGREQNYSSWWITVTVGPTTKHEQMSLERCNCVAFKQNIGSDEREESIANDQRYYYYYFVPLTANTYFKCIITCDVLQCYSDSVSTKTGTKLHSPRARSTPKFVKRTNL